MIFVVNYYKNNGGEDMFNRFMRKIKLFFKELINRIKRDSVTAMGAQLAYYLILSIFPFLIFFLNLLSYTPIARDEVLESLIVILPIDTQRLITQLLSETISKSSETLLSLGALTGIWAASRGIMSLIKSLNKAYGVEEKRSYIELRGVAILFTLALLVLLLIVLLTLVFGELLGNMLFDSLGLGYKFVVIWHYLRIGISLGFMILLFTLLYKFSPSIRNGSNIKFKHTFPGAVFTSFGWILTSSLFSYYVNNFGDYGKTYGSLGGIIVLLIWLYLSSIIIITGGEINGTIRSLEENK